ncbi:hypothetical protein HDU97_004275 [Phlyctochytrium planicorne]|nr:hypothetical protein HDU97_004275 [Phlyctochytrium planicorne]
MFCASTYFILVACDYNQSNASNLELLALSIRSSNQIPISHRFPSPKVSGEVPTEPVVSKKSGILYEKRLILKHIVDSGKEPGTGEELTEEDLLTVKLSSKVVRPRPPTVNSVPTLLTLLQNEWDSAMLETYQLKQQYHQVRQELSNALYENDAAKRVIARLIKERDQARENLATISAAAAAGNSAATVPEADSSAMDVDEAPAAEVAFVPKDVLEIITATAAKLSEARKSKKKAESSAATVDNVKSFSQVTAIPGLHTKVGITAMDLLVDTTSDEKKEWVLTTGNDGTAVVTNWREGEQVCSVKAHGSKKVSSAIWIDRGAHKDTHAFITGSVDKTAKVWSLSTGKPKLASTLSIHDGEVTSLSLHPGGSYFVSGSADGTWSFNDVVEGTSIARIGDGQGAAYTSLSFHPDGVLLGTGSKDSSVKIWDIKSGTTVNVFEEHRGAVNSIGFSENGYYLATSASEDPVVRIWDLRKLQNVFSIDLSSEGIKSVQKVAFDPSAQYLGVAAGSGLRLYLNKKWTELFKQTDVHAGDITDFKFGENSKYIASAGADRSIVVTGI